MSTHSSKDMNSEVARGAALQEEVRGGVPVHPAPQRAVEADGAPPPQAHHVSDIPVSVPDPAPGGTQEIPVMEMHPVPASEAPGTAPAPLPTNPSTSAAEQREAIRNEDPEVVGREVEKVAAAERARRGEAPAGTVVEGIENDELYALQRRFHTQINHVLSPARNLPPREPDLRTATDLDLPYRSDTLKSNFERLVAVLGPTSMRGVREVKRLTDWGARERWRTGTYCAAYFLSWVLGYTVVGATAFFIVLICFPTTRRYLFPERPPPPGQPPSATDPTNTKGDESFLGMADSKVAHRSKAEQAEEHAFEARALLEAYTHAVVLSGTGGRGVHRHKEHGAKEGMGAGVPDDSQAPSQIVDEEGNIVGVRKSTDSHSVSRSGHSVRSGRSASAVSAPGTAGTAGTATHEVVIGDNVVEAKSKKDMRKAAETEAKRKRDAIVAKMAKGTETGLGTLADVCEIVQHTFSPPHLYPDKYARFKLCAAALVPLGAALHFVPAWAWGRAATLSLGLGLWAHGPILAGVRNIISRIPNEQMLLDPRNSIFSGVPTNAQFTLHLLRVSEELGNPIPPPPPPPLEGTPKEAIKDTSPQVGVTSQDVQQVDDAGSGVEKTAAKAKVKTKGRIAGAFKKISRKLAGVHGDVAVDGKKKFSDKVLEKKYDKQSPYAFAAKLGKTAGHIVLDIDDDMGSAARTYVAFVPLSGDKASHVWDIDDLVEMSKDSVSVPRLALGWMGGADVESLGITLRFDPASAPLAAPKPDSHDGDSPELGEFHFASVDRRDQLFDRLVAIGPQRWEVL